MENKKIKKINVLYLLGYIFVPIIVIAICIVISSNLPKEENISNILIMGSILLSIAWWISGGKIVFKKNQKRLEKMFKEQGFVQNNTFYGDGAEVIVDVNAGKIGLQFFWNPSESYIISAKRIEKAWVEDGKSGAGFMEGSSCVSFLFTIDNVKVRVYTFKSNQRFKMNSNYILTGISKADKMVNVLENARNNDK